MFFLGVFGSPWRSLKGVTPLPSPRFTGAEGEFLAAQGLMNSQVTFERQGLVHSHLGLKLVQGELEAPC